MLNWWLGRPAEDATGDENDADIPETPAPVFAARAFKSAIFGTPSPREDEVLDKARRVTNVTAESNRQGAGQMSPTKPQGILLTPGTATTRRKTVSFGASVIDNEEKNAIGKSGIPNNCPGKFPSPWTPKVDDNLQLARRTALTRTLEAARDGEAKIRSSAETTNYTGTRSCLDTKTSGVRVPTPTPDDSTSEGVQLKIRTDGAAGKTAAIVFDDFDGDMTIDLNDPHSQSGRYWKSEYEKYHEEAKAQMRKLVKYKQLAKSYAKKKDCEAIDLGEKLREEQQKVTDMEGKISELVAEIADRRVNNATDESPDLMKDLARQTALAMEYRDQVNQFQIALVERDAQVGQQSDDGTQRHTSPRTARTLVETSRELKRAREQLAEMGSLRDDIHSLRLNLSAAEKKASRLQDENARLSSELAKVNEQLDRSEKRRQSAEAQNHKQDGLIESLQQDYNTLKELAKSQRRDAENLLRKRHDQAVSLKKEIQSLKTGKDFPGSKSIKGSATNDNGISKSLRMDVLGAVPLKSTTSSGEDLMSFETPPKSFKCKVTAGSEALDTIGDSQSQFAAKKHYQGQESLKPVSQAVVHLLDSQAPTAESSLENSGKGRRFDTHPTSRSATRRNGSRSSHPALSEIINDAHVNSSSEKSKAVPGSQLSPGLQERFSNLSLKSPGPALSQTTKNLRDIASPRPSIFHFPSSPPPVRQRSSGVRGGNKSNANPSSSRLSSMSSRGRAGLPPDRAAAAKARLEEKLAAKRRTQEPGDQKENIRH